MPPKGVFGIETPPQTPVYSQQTEIDYAKFPGLTGEEYYEKKLSEEIGALYQEYLKRKG
jgi:hypothetical protein